LRGILGSILGQEPEAVNVYFQPPGGHTLKFPCIIYALDKLNTSRADNLNYKITPTYEIKVIVADPDTPIPQRLMEDIPTCRFHRTYTENGMHHYILSAY
jgi:hypothetical protein